MTERKFCPVCKSLMVEQKINVKIPSKEFKLLSSHFCEKCKSMVYETNLIELINNEKLN